MKIFAVVLLMLLSTTLLKAQTMLVESADGVESFEVGEIRSLSSFEKNFKNIHIDIQSIPILVHDIKDYKDSGERNLIFNSRQNNLNRPLIVRNDTLVENEVLSGINFSFFFDAGNYGTGWRDVDAIKILFSKSGNSISKFWWYGGGSIGGCREGNFDNCIVKGNHEFDLQNLQFEIDSTEIFKVHLRKNEITKTVLKLFQTESLSQYYKYGPKGTFTIEILKIREQELTDESQIIITIE